MTTLYAPQPIRPYSTPSSPLFHLPSMPHLTHSTSYPCSSLQTPAASSKSIPRPKPTKKASSSTTKHKSVQTSLEVKVERAKGFQAFFVPLARSLPPAPPSSPVLGQKRETGREDYFMGWDAAKLKRRDEWVEDVDEEGSGMEVDSE